jgi:hypothetical protein
VITQTRPKGLVQAGLEPTIRRHKHQELVDCCAPSYSGHISVASLARYARVSPHALARWQQQRGSAPSALTPSYMAPHCKILNGTPGWASGIVGCSSARGHMPGLQIEGGLDSASEPGQRQFVELTDWFTDPRAIEPGEVSDVGPSVAAHGDREDVAWIAPLKFQAQQPWSW